MNGDNNQWWFGNCPICNSTLQVTVEQEEWYDESEFIARIAPNGAPEIVVSAYGNKIGDYPENHHTRLYCAEDHTVEDMLESPTFRQWMEKVKA